MCGIFGYIGKKAAALILEHGLQRLEYRGYDSAGIAVFGDNGSYKDVKAVGKVSFLSEVLDESLRVNMLFSCGIAHTRWATHGEPSQTNTHPHHDSNKEFWVVHNGIIENQRKLKNELEGEWYSFYSQTDTEVVPALLAKYWDGNLLSTVEAILPLLHGAYALLITTTKSPWEFVAVKRWSPLIFGTKMSSDEMFFSSDTQALADYADKIIHLQDGDLIHVKDGDYSVRAQGKVINKAMEVLEITSMESSKGKYDHYMLKEIYEQSAVLRRIFKWRVDFSDYEVTLEAYEAIKDMDIRKIVFVWCGTSYNAWLMWAVWIRELTGIDCDVQIASEYSSMPIVVDDTVLHIFLSQSGETADSIEVLKYIKARGGKTFGIVNVVWSTLARETDCGIFMRAGFEIGVASTKAFTAQMMCILLLTLKIGKHKSLQYTHYKQIISEIQKIPTYIEHILDQSAMIQSIAKELSWYKNAFFLGRYYQYPIATEGSLKLKEISYIHSESYPAGELKHGPLALIEESVPSILLMPHDEHYEQNLSSLSEIQSRKWKVLTIGDVQVDDADWHITIPKTLASMYPFLTVVVCQLLSYYVALDLDRDIDKPRNLAKSVTVK